jgi:DNA-binding transcriptional LysR family regulator
MRSDISMTNIRKIDLNLLAVLDALLDERSVTRAAERLGFSQPAVSGMLARLRDLFGDPLFVRAQRGLLPTPRALALSAPLKQLIEDGQRLVAREEFDPAVARATFTISSNDYMQRTLLVPFVTVLRAEAPQVQLAIVPPLLEGLGQALSRGTVDLAVTIPEFALPDLRSRLLYRENYVAVVRRQHPLARASKLAAEEFCGYDHVIVSPTGGSFEGPIDRSLALQGLKRTVRYSVPSFLLIPDILQTDDLIAAVPSRLLLGSSADLVVLPFPIDVPGFDVIAAWHPRLDKDAAHRWLRTRLAQTGKSMIQEVP